MKKEWDLCKAFSITLIPVALSSLLSACAARRLLSIFLKLSPNCLSGRGFAYTILSVFLYTALSQFKRKEKNPESASYKASRIPITEDSDDREHGKTRLLLSHGPAFSAGRLHRGADGKDLLRPLEAR
jgi:hypothetical protein